MMISWCNLPSRARELTAFFADNVESSYISHSELQGPRALSSIRWRDNLPSILEDEIEPRLRAWDGSPSRVSRPILVAEEVNSLVALSLVTFAAEASVPFAVVEDLIVAQSRRSRGIGKAVLDWIAAEAISRGIHRLFLESGVTNQRAHHFFEREGFKTCSIVMLRSLENEGMVPHWTAGIERSK